MDDEVNGFIDDQQIVVFVENIEGKVEGNQIEGFGFGDGNVKPIAGFELLFFLGTDLVVQADVSLFDEVLKARSR